MMTPIYRLIRIHAYLTMTCIMNFRWIRVGTRRETPCMAILIAGCLAASVLAQSPDYTPQPIPTSGPPLNSPYRNTVYEWNLRTLVEAYQRHGLRDPAWNPSAHDFLTEMAARFTPPHTSRLSREALLELSSSILQLGCDDPLILYLRGGLLADLGQEEEGVILIRRAQARFQAEASYPYARMFFAPFRLGSFELARGQPAVESWELAADWLLLATLQGEFSRPLEERLLLERCLMLVDRWSQHGGDREQFLDNLLSRFSGVAEQHPWLLWMLEAHRELVRAESNAVGSNANPHTDRARALLDRAYARHPEYPEAATLRIRASRLAGTPSDDPPRRWFDLAVAADVYHDEAYEELIEALRPAWGGSHEAMLAFGIECLDTGLHQRGIPNHLWTVVNRMAEDLPIPGLVFRNPRVVSACSRWLEGIIERTRHDRIRIATHARLGMIHAWARNPERAREHIRAAGSAFAQNRYPPFPSRWFAPRVLLNLNLPLEEHGVTPDPGHIRAELTYRHPEAEYVSVIGSFNHHQPDRDPMVRDDDGIWRVTLLLPPFHYGYRFYVDGRIVMDPLQSSTTRRGTNEMESLLIINTPSTHESLPPAVPGPVQPQRVMEAQDVADDGMSLFDVIDRIVLVPMVIRYQNPDAGQVAIAGEFNRWSTTSHPLERMEDGWWHLELKLPPGESAYKFVVDGQWILDPEQPRVKEVDGSLNSLLIIPAGDGEPPSP